MNLSISQVGAAPTTLNEQWATHQQHCLTWAFRAYERFVKSLSPEIRERLAHKDHQEEAYVVVFGKTQVGKTTLLMDLMGVSPTAMMRVSTVLRGGRAHGHSATATTMEYRRSEDERWGLRIQNEDCWYDDDSQIASALGKLREKMERRDLVLASPCVVSIPTNCFVIPTDQAPAVKMLDLPGDKPANQVEQEHVLNMARRYVPLADLILLVGRGDDLSFLQPGGLTLPGIEDWQSVPGRFRIVTTYSFTAKSVRDLTRQDGKTADTQFYRQRLIEQIEKFAPLSEVARMPRRYFPLEFGATWIAAQASRPELYARVSPLIDELKRELHQDIQKATKPQARLQNAVDAHVVINRVKENRLKEMEQTTASLCKVLEQEENDLKRVQIVRDQASKEHNDLHERLLRLTDERLQQDLTDHFRLSGSTPLEDPGERVSGFRVLISRARASLIHRMADSRPETASLPDTAWFWRGVRVDFEQVSDQIRKDLNSAFNGFESHLSDYVLDKYWFTGSDSDYQSDRQRLEKCIKNAESVTLGTARDWWLKAATQHLQELRKELKALQQKIDAWSSRIEEVGQLLEEAQQKADAHEKYCEEFKTRMDLDLKESRRFIEILDDEYLVELRHRRQNIYKKSQPAQVFIDILAAKQLIEIREKLLSQIEYTPA